MKLYGFAWPGAVLSLFFIFPALIIGLIVIVVFALIFKPKTREQSAALICLEGGHMNRDNGNFEEAVYWYKKFLTHKNMPNVVREDVMNNIVFCKQQK